MSDTDHTSDPMGNDVLDELMSLLAAATPGQWWYGTPDDTTQTVAEWMATCSPDPDAHAAGRLHLLWTPGETGPLITAITGDGPTSEANAKLLWAAHEYLPALVSDLRTAEARATAAEVASRGYRERAEKAEAKAARFAGLLGHQSRALTDAIATEVLRQKADAWDEGHHAGHEEARAVHPTYPDPTPNPCRQTEGASWPSCDQFRGRDA